MFCRLLVKEQNTGNQGRIQVTVVKKEKIGKILVQKPTKEGPTSCEKPGGTTPQVDGWPAVPTAAQPSHQYIGPGAKALYTSYSDEDSKGAVGLH